MSELLIVSISFNTIISAFFVSFCILYPIMTILDGLLKGDLSLVIFFLDLCNPCVKTMLHSIV